MPKRDRSMTDDELKQILSAEIRNALGYLDGELAEQRGEALDYYLGEPFGNEIDGRSQVVTREVLDTVEWSLPSLIKIFTSSYEAVNFEPQGPEDEDAAKQETDYVNYVFNKENDGFKLFYVWFKDALLQKNGVVKHYFEQTEHKERETYKGLLDDEFVAIMSSDEIEAVAHDEYKGMLNLDGVDNEVTLHDITLMRTEKRGRVVIEPVPPEEFLISRRAKSIDDAKFVGHRVSKTRSELIEMGYPRKVVENLPTYDEIEYNEERLRRFKNEDEWPHQATTLNRASEPIWLVESYIRVDYDGDGVAELRKITSAGADGYEILDNEEIDAIPFSSLTPIIMPHKWVGLSVADLVMDLQLIKSTLLRQILDNLYLINNQRHVVVENMVNLDDLLESRPGGVIRAKAQGMVEPFPTTPFTGHAFGMLEYLDTLRENRTGVTKYNQGLDANTLNKTATGITQIMSAAQQRIELIARIFAETGVKHLFMAIHALLQKHQNKEKVIKLRNKWVTVDPSEWRTRYNMTVNVGLGTGDKNEMITQLMALYNIQKEVLPFGLATPDNVYNTLSDMIEATGKRSPEKYFTPPETNEIPQPPPDPQIEVDKAKLELEQQKNQISAQKLEIDKEKNDIARMKLELEDKWEMMKLQLENEQIESNERISILNMQSQQEENARENRPEPKQEAPDINVYIDNAKKPVKKAFTMKRKDGVMSGEIEEMETEGEA